MAKVKLHTFVFTHTALAKLFGAGCFFTPFSVHAGTDATYVTVLWVIACLTAVEMIAIQLFCNHADHDILFLAGVRRSNERFNEESADGLRKDMFA